MHTLVIKSKLTNREVTATVTPLMLLESNEIDLVDRLTECDCQPVGETNVVDCECYLEWEDYTLTIEDNAVAEVEGEQPSEGQISEVVKNLRTQADGLQEDALNNQGTNMEIKLVATMYAYREIANELENKFINTTWDGKL